MFKKSIVSRSADRNFNPNKLIDRLDKAGQAAGFTVEQFGHVGDWPLLGMTRAACTANTGNLEIYLSAGIHGDEPAGPQALLELLEADALARNHRYTICPLLNPGGIALGTRENAEGIDLNRDYRALVSDEIGAHVSWIQQRVKQLDLSLLLHEDWESDGVYLYELNFAKQPGYAEHILTATRAHLPTETNTTIDGHTAYDGIIRHDRLPEIEDGDPEAIYLYKTYRALNYTLETPSAQDFRKRVYALKASVLCISDV